MKPRLAIILTHPIQYYSPLFLQLCLRAVIEIKVFYTWGQSATGKKFDKGFGREVEWDLPLLEGYASEFLTNTSTRPGYDHFLGIVNPDAVSKIESYKPDALLIFGWAFISHLKIMLHFKNRIPVIFRGDSTLLDEHKGIKTLARYIYLRWIYRHVDKALFVGKNNYKYYIKFGIKPAQLTWAPHSIDNNRFIQNETGHSMKAVTWRKSLGIQETDFVFLFAGKFEPKKDPFTLLNAFMESGYKQTVHLVFAGNGVLENALKESARYNLQVHFIEFQNQQAMPALYRLADVFVLPSGGPEETWGLAVNEAMACGRAVIVSDKCGCAPDLVDNGINGYIFKAGDVKDLIQKMNLLCNNTSLLQSMQRASAEKIRKYSIDTICEVLESVVSSAKKQG